MATTLRIDSVSGGEQFQILYSFNGGPTVGRLFADRGQAAAFVVEQLGTEEVVLAMLIAFWLARDIGLSNLANVLGKTLMIDWTQPPSQIVRVA